MKSKDLLHQISDLETTLANFSFEELSVTEASQLKKSFDLFKAQLENRIWGDHGEGDEATEDRDEKQQQEAMLIATVSHEIRTPLNGIIGFTDLLREGPLTEEQRTQVEAIQTASHSLKEIINELLEYARLSAELDQFEAVDFNMESIIQDTIYLCNTLILGKRIKLKLQVDPNIPKVLIGDPSKLSQILLNLLGNAIKFVDQGEIGLKVQQEAVTKKRAVLNFEVRDTGIGISEQDIKHIFDSFKQADQHTFSKYGGSGLGLSIVKQIVEKLDGSISVTSQVGVGTTFSFQLPFGIGTKAVAGNLDTAAATDASQVRGLRLLVFEDNVLNQRLIETRLKSWGCVVYITDNPVYGLHLLETKPIDIILMDLRMPVMDGFEVTRRIRENSRSKINQLPIVAITADFTAEDQNACTAQGIDDYILKPYSPGELLSKLIKHHRRKERGSGLNRIASKSDREAEGSAADQVNLNKMLKECMGEFELLEELIGLYKQNALEFIGRMKVALKNKDLESIAFAAHKIKSGLKMIGTLKLLNIVDEIHSASKAHGELQYIKGLYEGFIKLYPLVETEIDAELEKMKRSK